MLLTIDVGNTNVVLGCIENGRVLSCNRTATNVNELANDYVVKMRQFFEYDGIDYKSFEGAIMSSVVPQVNTQIKDAVKKLTGLDCMVVGAGLRTGVNIKLDDPGQLAADLLTGAVGALALYKPPIIIVDMGTASTVMALDKDGAFLGGAIIPGVMVSLSALISGTSLLPSIAIDAPEHCIGRNTIDCMRSGSVIGSAAMIDGMIGRMEEELEGEVTVVATGGISRTVIPHCRREIHYEPDLLLKGLEVIYEKNKNRRRQ